MASSKYRFKHSYKLVRGKSHSTRAANIRFGFEQAKLRFRAIANYFPKSMQRDIASRVMKFYRDHPRSRSSPNSVYAYLVCWYNMYAKLGLTTQKIAHVFGMNASTLSANYERYAWQTELSKIDNPLLVKSQGAQSI